MQCGIDTRQGGSGGKWRAGTVAGVDGEGAMIRLDTVRVGVARFTRFHHTISAVNSCTKPLHFIVTPLISCFPQLDETPPRLQSFFASLATGG